MAGKPEGKTLNIKEVSGKTAEGKAIWKSLGRTFVRTDLSGGALWEGEGENEKTYSLVPHEGTPKAGGKTFDVVEKQDGGETVVHGRLYVRPGLTGGAYWVDEGGNEKEYAAFPRDFKPGAKKPAAAAPAPAGAPVNGA
jgi:hypothetical protein